MANPAVTNTKKSKKCPKKCPNPTTLKIPEEVCKVFEPSKQRSTLNNLKNPSAHPDDCCCAECDKNDDTEMNDDCDTEFKQKNQSKGKLSKQESCSMMANSHTDKCMKNYLYDNPELKESKSKKSCAELDNDSGSDTEVWILQCPKNFDPSKLIGFELGKIGKQLSADQAMECSADRFSEKKTLAVIAPEKAAELQIICDNLILVKPVGKLVISEKFQIEEGCEKGGASEKKSNTTKQSSIASSSGSSCCSSDAESNDIADDDDKCNSSDQEVKPIAGKKIQKKLNDQCFTIETTVTVEKCADRKKGKKKGMTNEANRLSESSPQKKKKMSSQRGTELGC